MEKEWKNLVYQGIEYNNFEVSNLGDIRNKTTKNVLKHHLGRYFEARIALGKKNKNKNIYIHRAIAENFIPNPENYNIVNHKDGDNLNDEIGNLEWCTSSYNNKHCYDIGHRDKTKISGENCIFSKLKLKEVKEIRDKHSRGIPSSVLAKEYNINKSNISHIVNYKTWKNI